VIFVGTSTGQLLKAVTSPSPKTRISARTVLIEEIEVTSSAIRSVTVINTKKGEGHVLVTGAEEIKSFPLYRCEKAKNCNDCVALQDPYCAWAVRGEKCEGAQSWAKGSQTDFLQSIPTGRHSSCPGGEALPTVPTSKDQLMMGTGTVINQVGQERDIEILTDEEKEAEIVIKNSESKYDGDIISRASILEKIEDVVKDMNLKVFEQDKKIDMLNKKIAENDKKRERNLRDLQEEFENLVKKVDEMSTKLDMVI